MAQPTVLIDLTMDLDDILAQMKPGTLRSIHLSQGKGIAVLMDDPERRKKMGEKGRERIEKELAWRHQEKFLLEAYEALVSQ